MSKEFVVRSMRLSETVSPFGPGAIVDILGESFMAPTGEHWPPVRLRNEIVCEALAVKLGVSELWTAPSHGDPDSLRIPGLEFPRFPSWLFCQECRQMTRWGKAKETSRRPECPRCDGRMVPMRFVAVCTEKSHITDVPWVEWVHRGGDVTCKSKVDLSFAPVKGGGEGLRSLEVSCSACNSRRSLGELRGETLLQEGLNCRGTQPWETEWKTCGKPLEVQQRGATSLHFGETISAIDIPEVDGRIAEFEEKLRQHPFFAAVIGNLSSALAEALIPELAANLGHSESDVRARLALMNDDAPPLRATKQSLLSDEYEAFVAAIAGAAPAQDFITRLSRVGIPGTPLGSELAQRMDDVVLVDRLREVRVSLGFRRHTLDAELIPSVPRNPSEKRWYPAVEGFGEGIFIHFEAAELDRWAAQPTVIERIGHLGINQTHSLVGSRLPIATPQYVLLHTFAHALMRELAFRSGYSAPSLRERVYCEERGDYGVFIYTTSSDIEGTLGGLVRQGEAAYLDNAIIRAVEQLSWCPNDPVCSESSPQSIDGLNLAACHACILAPETSCESYNLLLDRTLLVGSSTVPGYFEGVIHRVLETAVRAEQETR